jgi:hypothetical protein
MLNAPWLRKDTPPPEITDPQTEDRRQLLLGLIAKMTGDKQGQVLAFAVSPMLKRASAQDLIGVRDLIYSVAAQFEAIDAITAIDAKEVNPS